ncbi:MAG TPA: mannosyltransferase family protein [Actinomycetales bacterium]|nr:mannosyltransferase family protein [Actinomycetales bacterium]
MTGDESQGRMPSQLAVPSSRRHVVSWWYVSRALLAVVVVGWSWATGVAATLLAQDPGRWLAERFTWWDSWHYVRIAEVGYLPPGLPCCDQAFFPGYPLLMALLAPLLAGSVVAAGLVVSWAASGAAAGLLHRVGELQAPGSGRWAVLYLGVAPLGIFLSAVYTEALFLALSLGAWLLGRRERWWWAALAAAGACAVRVNGVFLVAALVVMRIEQGRRRGSWLPRGGALAVLLAPLTAVAYVVYLSVRTGRLGAWQEAQSTGWVRQIAWPWQGLAAGWHAATSAKAWDVTVARWADLACVIAGIALTAALVWLRRWAEALLMLLNLAVLVCSTMLTSSARYALMWFPGYLLLAELTLHERWRFLRWLVPVVCAPALVVLSVAFADHRWIG